MLETTLPKLEQLVTQLIEQNNTLKQEVNDLKSESKKLLDENETLQLEALDNEENQKNAASTLEKLLTKLQNTQQA